MSKRATWDFKAPGSWDDEQIEITATINGLAVTITDVQAMGSYNSDVSCEIFIPQDKVIELQRFLAEFDWSEDQRPKRDRDGRFQKSQLPA